MLGRAIVKSVQHAQVRSISSTTAVLGGPEKNLAKLMGEKPMHGTGEPVDPILESPPPEIAAKIYAGAKEPLHISQETKDTFYHAIGNRDIVGPVRGFFPEYLDEPDHPFPAIRFGANTPEVLALREKETGDWKSLTLKEKQALYRASFQKTFAEMEVNDGTGKRILAHLLAILGISCLYQTYIQTRLCPTEPGYDQASMNERVVYQVIVGNNPIMGVGDKYDYENNQWKK